MVGNLFFFLFWKWLTSGNNLGDQRKKNPVSNEISVVSPKLCSLHSGISTTAVAVTVLNSPTEKFRLSYWTSNFFPTLGFIVAIIATDKTSLLDTLCWDTLAHIFILSFLEIWFPFTIVHIWSVQWDDLIHSRSSNNVLVQCHFFITLIRKNILAGATEFQNLLVSSNFLYTLWSC